MWFLVRVVSCFLIGVEFVNEILWMIGWVIKYFDMLDGILKMRLRILEGKLVLI